MSSFFKENDNNSNKEDENYEDENYEDDEGLGDFISIDVINEDGIKEVVDLGDMQGNNIIVIFTILI